jgi:hypothetical protein
MFTQQSDAAQAIAKRNQIFAEQTNADGRAIGLRYFFRQKSRKPVMPHQFAQRLFRTDLRE